MLSSSSSYPFYVYELQSPRSGRLPFFFFLVAAALDGSAYRYSLFGFLFWVRVLVFFFGSRPSFSVWFGFGFGVFWGRFLTRCHHFFSFTSHIQSKAFICVTPNHHCNNNELGKKYYTPHLNTTASLASPPIACLSILDSKGSGAIVYLI